MIYAKFVWNVGQNVWLTSLSSNLMWTNVKYNRDWSQWEITYFKYLIPDTKNTCK